MKPSIVPPISELVPAAAVPLAVPVIHLATDVLFRIAVFGPYLADELVAVAFGHRDLIVSHLAPFFLDLALHLVPATSNLVLVHSRTPRFRSPAWPGWSRLGLNPAYATVHDI